MADPVWPEAELVRQLELRLLEPAVRRSADHVAALLHEDFTDFGSSGRVFNRAQIIEALGQESEEPTIEREVRDLQVHHLGPGIALVTYRIVRREPPDPQTKWTLRSSLWQRVADRWQMRFHQGTRVP